MDWSAVNKESNYPGLPSQTEMQPPLTYTTSSLVHHSNGILSAAIFK